ncbi:hypothetical protein NDU88_004533 [Pleurodeles waltl]|uniref:Uncharacterized protein n=1 Tax=Pleurodeles waltl TaxID=8319 RepID=A0AAV7MWN5_PLEWA|nr:hypothetical protein NDU88_004533 [Pleurodeles waltl]
MSPCVNSDATRSAPPLTSMALRLQQDACRPTRKFGISRGQFSAALANMVQAQCFVSPTTGVDVNYVSDVAWRHMYGDFEVGLGGKSPLLLARSCTAPPSAPVSQVQHGVDWVADLHLEACATWFKGAVSISKASTQPTH